TPGNTRIAQRGEHFLDVRGGLNALAEDLVDLGIPAIHQVEAEQMSFGFNLRLNAGHAAPGKTFAAVFVGDWVSGFRQPAAQHVVGRRLGVYQNVVAVEDDEGRAHAHAVPVEPKPRLPRSVEPPRLRSSRRA